MNITSYTLSTEPWETQQLQWKGSGTKQKKKSVCPLRPNQHCLSLDILLSVNMGCGYTKWQVSKRHFSVPYHSWIYPGPAHSAPIWTLEVCVAAKDTVSLLARGVLGFDSREEPMGSCLLNMRLIWLYAKFLLMPSSFPKRINSACTTQEFGKHSWLLLFPLHIHPGSQ